MRCRRRPGPFTAAATAIALPAPNETLKVSTSPYAEEIFRARNIRVFVRDVEGETGGRLTIQPHDIGALPPMPPVKRGGPDRARMPERNRVLLPSR